MSTPVVMPQMGESIAEGTVVRWIKRVGDVIDRDEPLFEISTDKVDAEIPSPAAGVLLSIAVGVGETVPVGSVVATIGAPGDVVADAAPHTATPSHAAVTEPSRTPAPTEAAAGPAASTPHPSSNGHTKRSRNGHGASAVPGVADDRRRARSSPLVRRMAQEHGVDIRSLKGSGVGGRITKQDVLAYLEHADASDAPAGTSASPAPPAAGPAVAPRAKVPGGRVDIVPLSPIRKKIAEHMVLSRRTSAHVHSVFHVDFSAVDVARRDHRAAFEAAGTKLTYMTAITRAVVAALGRHPIVNASLDGDNALYRKDINIGIAVALDSGLIVPVVKHADMLGVMDLSKAITDLATRARSKQLKPDDVQGGTFTITNPGQLGAQFGLPIISQPQVAILGVGSVDKRPVVVDDAVVVRPMAYLTLGFDHRLIDGAVADHFMADVKHEIEHFSVDVR